MMATMTPLANGGIESTPRGKNNSTPVVGGGGTVLSSPKRGHSNNNRLLKAEAHRVLADQLSRGRIAPKAKFRADDEISIGEPSVMVSPRTVSYASEDSALPGGRGEEEDGEGPASDSPRQQSQPRVVSGGSPDRKYQLEVKQQRQLSTTQQQQQVLKHHNSNSVKGAPQRLSLPQPPGPSGVRAATTVGKSASLDNYYNSANSNSSNNAANKSKIQSAKSSGVTLLQRLSSLRLSFNSHDRRGGGSNSSPYKITPHLTDSDSGFFAGIAAAGGKRRPLAPYEVRHGPNLVVTPLVELHKAPPKRRRPKRRQGCSSGGGGSRNPERSYSFTDAQFIAQAVVEGDTALIEELYPSFPASSDPIYTVIKKNRRARTSVLTAGGDGPRTMTAMVRPNFLSDFEARGSSLVHPADRQPMAGEAAERSPRASSCATGGRRKSADESAVFVVGCAIFRMLFGGCKMASDVRGS
jgi:hypothetical protein